MVITLAAFSYSFPPCQIMGYFTEINAVNQYLSKNACLWLDQQNARLHGDFFP